jgi:ABC-type branched-subunit amino acid transport system substrate-binding protein
MARLSHPNVVVVYDVGEHEGRVFVAMEFIDGRTLREHLAERARSVAEIMDVFLAAGRGLAAAHEAGLVHRDFKPDNVLVRRDGRVCVTDFGLARLSGREALDGGAVASSPAAADPALTHAGALIGTPAYMAPEQLEGGGADVRSDVFAFCVALWEALQGDRPFRGDTIVALLSSIRAGARPGGRSRIPSRLRRVLLRGLCADPAERPASMSEVLAALERARRPSWRRSAVLGGALIALAAAVLSLANRAPHRGTTGETSASSSAAAPAAAAGRCASNRQCVEAHGGQPYLCRASSGACAPVASEDCVVEAEPADLVADDTVWLGSLFPAKGPGAEAYGRMNLEGVDFARKEIAQATRALVGAGASMHVRPIALVACDDSEDAMRAARHLVDDVGVPAILGFRSGQEVVDLAGGLLIRRGVLSVASLTPSPLITRLPQPDQSVPMVWRTTFSLDDMAKALGRLIPDVFEPRRRPQSGRMRVTLAREDSASTLSFAEALYDHLKFNGRPAAENGSDYQALTFPGGALSDADVADAAHSIVATRPSLVVLICNSTVAASIVQAIEVAWPRASERPTYLLPNAVLTPFADFLGDSAERRARVFSVGSDSGSKANARFVMRYNAAHADHVSLTASSCVSYDALYLLAYATFALGDERVTGAALARAIGRLVPPGEPVEVGPTRLFDALKLLAAGRNVDVQGTASDLDFDLATGEAPSDFALRCAAVDAEGRANGDQIEPGVVFRARTGRVEGTLRCP